LGASAFESLLGFPAGIPSVFCSVFVAFILRVSFIIVVSDLLTVEVVSGMVAVGAEGSDFISAVALVVETTVKELLLASVIGLGEATVGVAGWLTLVDAGAAFYSAYVVVLLASVVLETVAAAAVVLLVRVATAGG